MYVAQHTWTTYKHMKQILHDNFEDEFALFIHSPCQKKMILEEKQVVKNNAPPRNSRNWKTETFGPTRNPPAYLLYMSVYKAAWLLTARGQESC